MKLKQIKNDGVFEKKEATGFHNVHECGGYNQAKSELSEAELVVDEERLSKLIAENIDINFPHDAVISMKCGDLAKALASYMSEWLTLSKGEE